jgi:hypothetical protein
MELKWLALSLAIIFGAELAFYPALALGPRRRTVAFFGLLIAAILSPLIVPAGVPLLRFISAVCAVTAGVKLYDHYRGAGAGFRPGAWLYTSCLFNPFALVLRQVAREKQPSRNADAVSAAIALSIGSSAAVLIVAVFCVDWRHHSFIEEHCAKAISLFLMIQFLPNGVAAVFRLIGIPSTNFAGPFFLARTPAEFWRFYNRPVNQFFNEYVFRPAGGLAHPIRATLLVFVISGIVHEYVFDLPAGRVLGSQMCFFLIQGLAVVVTLRLRPRGWLAVPMTLLTFAFNLAAVRLFLAGLNAVAPFYVNRSP